MRIILGDNPLFHINHQSGPTRKSIPFFKESPEIISEFLDNGGVSMMLSNSDHIEHFLDYCQARVDLKRLDFLYVIPAMNNMNERAAQAGLFGLVSYYIKQLNISDLRLAFKLSFNPITIFQYLIIIIMIRVQIYPMVQRKLKIDYLCLHNVATDLLVGSASKSKIRMWIKICKSLGFKPLLITQNILKFEALNITEDCAVCFSFNKNGYLVNPNLMRVSDFLKRQGKVLNREYYAMQVLAGGDLSPEDAIEHSLEYSFDGILYATTKVDRIAEFFDKVKIKYIK